MVHLITPTTNGYLVGDSGGVVFLIYMPDGRGNYSGIELYGPTLALVRLARHAEKIIMERGGDVRYITNEGVFQASQFTE